MIHHPSGDSREAPPFFSRFSCSFSHSRAAPFALTIRATGLHSHLLMTSDTLRIGAIGTGGFGLFALQQFLQIPGVQLLGIAGTHREAALAMARRFGVPDVVDV